MISIRHILLLMAVAFWVCSGCAPSKKTRMPEVDVKDFQERCTYQFQMPLNSTWALVTVFSMPQVVLANIELSDNTEHVLYVRLYEKQHLNIDKHLVRNLEYIYDRESRTLKVIFDLPVLYLLKESLGFRIEAVVTGKKNSHVTGRKIEKQISFYWSPHDFVKEPESGHVLMKYVDPVYQDYEGKDELVEKVKQEYLITNTKRLNPEYLSLIESFSGKVEQ